MEVFEIVVALLLGGATLAAVVDRVSGPTAGYYGAVAAAVCTAVILARIAWVAGAAAFDDRWRLRTGSALTRREEAVVAWCGMRGTVTLAAALALPAGVDGVGSFPHRDLILVTSFGVVLGTLVLQGLTLRPLLRWLRLTRDDSVDREVGLARIETLRAAEAAAADIPEIEATALVRRRYELELRRAETESLRGWDDDLDVDAQQATAIVVRTTLAAQRGRLVALRTDETIGYAAFQCLQRELDWAELGWAQLLPSLAGERDEETPHLPHA